LRRREGLILWLAYFDATQPRSRGRRVPRHLAVEKPTLAELEEAARRAGFQVVAVEPEAKYPALWYEQQGRILVKASVKKSQVVRAVAKELLELRKSAPVKRRR